jgi:hypothetical protein
VRKKECILGLFVFIFAITVIILIQNKKRMRQTDYLGIYLHPSSYLCAAKIYDESIVKLNLLFQQIFVSVVNTDVDRNYLR